VAKRSGIVTLVTDFGTRDPYAAALEAALMQWPQLRVVHVSHQVAVGDIRSGAYLMEYAARSFPAGTVHLGVVDPGVGTDRPMLAIDTDDEVLIGPENGLLDRALRGRKVREAVALQSKGPHSWTFESRDVMAPAAGRIASGEDLGSVGSAAKAAGIRDAPLIDLAQVMAVEVAYIDQFGTLVLDVRHPGEWPNDPGELTIVGRRVTLGRTFADVHPGQLVAYRGSLGYVEIASRDESAARALGVKVGDRIQVGPWQRVL
jgi:S-adenosylmethionine hydrolase